MSRKLIDILMHLENDIKSDSSGFEPKIEYVCHKDSVDELASFPLGLTAEIYPMVKPGLTSV